MKKASVAIFLGKAGIFDSLTLLSIECGISTAEGYLYQNVCSKSKTFSQKSFHFPRFRKETCTPK